MRLLAWSGELWQDASLNQPTIERGMSEGMFDKARVQAMVTMKRAGTPDEIAALVAFICSEDTAYLSGQIICVNEATG